MGFIKEFREFALKGNVVDLAVGVIIGGAFGKIVTAMVDDIVMPLPASIGKTDFSNMYVGLTTPVRDAVLKDPNLSLADARKVGPVLAYGDFITVTINFLILAFCIFLMVKAINMARARFEKQQAAVPAPPAADVILLTEIRDLLKQGR